MKINKSSLHFQLNQIWLSTGEELPKTICSYFWYTIFNIIRSIIIGTMGCSIVVFFLSPICKIFTTDELINSLGTASLYLDSLIFSILIGGLFFNKSSFGRIVWEYIKTFKTKICPLIEYEGK